MTAFNAAGRRRQRPPGRLADVDADVVLAGPKLAVKVLLDGRDKAPDGAWVVRRQRGAGRG
jgi:hypothetical protein